MVTTNSLNNTSTLWNVGASAAAATATYPMTVGIASDAAGGARFRNTSAGTSGLFQLEVSSDTAAGYLTVGSSTHTTARWKNRAEFSDSTASSGVNITTTAAAGDIRFYVAGNTLAATMSSAAVLSLTNPLPASSGGTGGGALTGVLTGNGASAMSASTVTQYAPLIGGASNAVSSTAVGSAGQVFRSSGAGVNPVWSTATFPATATTTGTVLRADGTNWVITQSTFADLYGASTILYSNGANNVAGLATANNAILNTSATGVPSITTTPSFGTLTLTGTSLTPLNLECTDAGASTGPVIDCYRNSASPLANDALGTIGFTGMSSTAVKRTYASITGNAITVTNAAEDGSLNLNIMSAGTLTTVGTLTKTGLNSTAIGATTTSTGAFTTLAATSQTITTTGVAPLTITSTDAGSGGAIIETYRNSASPAAADVITSFYSYGGTTDLTKVLYAGIDVAIVAATNGAQSGKYVFYTFNAGASTAQLNMLNTGCQVRGNNTNTAPPAGFMGEQLQTVVARAAAVVLTTATAANVTSVSLTAGVWDVSAIVGGLGVPTGTYINVSITSTSATIGASTTWGDSTVTSPEMPTANTDTTRMIPQYRIVLAGTTTYYLVAEAAFTVGGISVYGRLTATRVG